MPIIPNDMLSVSFHHGSIENHGRKYKQTVRCFRIGFSLPDLVSRRLHLLVAGGIQGEKSFVAFVSENETKRLQGQKQKGRGNARNGVRMDDVAAKRFLTDSILIDSDGEFNRIDFSCRLAVDPGSTPEANG